MTNVHCYMFKTLLSSCADSASGVARMGRGRSAFPLNFGKAVEPYFDFFDCLRVDKICLSNPKISYPLNVGGQCPPMLDYFFRLTSFMPIVVL